MRAAVLWHVSLCAVVLTNDSRSFAAVADQAQHSAAPKDERVPAPLEDTPIVITGSRIPRTDLTAVSPVTLIEAGEIKLQGATNVEEVLNQLPQVNPSQGLLSPPGTTGTATVDLRGIGSVRTLVLVDGHRLMPGDPRHPEPDMGRRQLLG